MLDELIQQIHKDGLTYDLSMILCDGGTSYKFWCRINKFYDPSDSKYGRITFHGEGKTIVEATEDAYKKCKAGAELHYGRF